MGNELRQTYRTMATPAGVSELDARMLMNNSVPGVNYGYITWHNLLEDHLRTQQQAISDTIFSAAGDFMTKHHGVRDWLGAGGARRRIARAQEDFEKREIKDVALRRRKAA